MLSKLQLSAVLLSVASLASDASGKPPWNRGFPGQYWQPPTPFYYPQTQIRQGYHVQFRQPYWQQSNFGSYAELMAFVEAQQRNGWEVQILPGHGVRYRLMQWGGSRLVGSMEEAQYWAAVLEGQGYESRIVNYP